MKASEQLSNSCSIGNACMMLGNISEAQLKKLCYHGLFSPIMDPHTWEIRIINDDNFKLYVRNGSAVHVCDSLPDGKADKTYGKRVKMIHKLSLLYASSQGGLYYIKTPDGWYIKAPGHVEAVELMLMCTKYLERHQLVKGMDDKIFNLRVSVTQARDLLPYIPDVPKVRMIREKLLVILENDRLTEND